MFGSARTPADHHDPPDTAVGGFRSPACRSRRERLGPAAVLPVLLLFLAGCGSSGPTEPVNATETSTPEVTSSEPTVRPTRSAAPLRTAAPEPVVTADPTTEPLPAPDTVDAGSDPAQFLGTTYEDQAFLDYLTVNDCYRGVAVRLVCPAVGVEFAINDAHQVSAVFFAPGYIGELPGGVEFGATPEEVVARLGEPDSSTSTSMTWWITEDVRLIVSTPVDPAAGLTVNQVSLQLG